MALGSYGTALGWLGSETGKSIIRVLFDYNQLCTSKLEMVFRFTVEVEAALGGAPCAREDGEAVPLAC